MFNEIELFKKLQENIKEDFPSAMISLIDMSEMSTQYTGLKVEFERDILSPVFNFDKIRNSIHTEWDLERISRLISNEIKKAVVFPEANLDILKDYNRLKERLCVDVIPVKKHEQMLKKVPYQMLNRDMAVIAKAFLMDSIEKADRLYMTTIDNSTLTSIGVSAETLLKDAVENSANINPVELLTVSDFIYGESYYTNPETLAHENAKFPMRILVTLSGACPVASMLNQQMLQGLGHQYEGNFYLVPSSLGCFTLPTEFPKSKDIIMSVEKAIKEWCELSGKHELVGEVQHYDRNSGVLEPKAVFEQRLEQLVQEQIKEQQREILEKKPEKGKDLGR